MTWAGRWLAYNYNPNDVKPGWGALMLVVGLGVVIYFLWRSMNKQLGRIQMPPREKPSTPVMGETPGPRSSPVNDEPESDPPAPPRPAP